MENFNEMADLAQSILNENTGYSRNKRIIKELFNNSTDIELRLRVIDSMYSTQMSKRLFGIDDIARAINVINGLFNENCDKAIRQEIINTLNGNDSTIITELLQSTYGRSKLEDRGVKATSLISKYLYFVNNSEFPIYDSLVKDSYRLFQIGTINEGNFIEKLRELNKNSRIKSYDKLDQFLWLAGKLKKGSLSLILDKKKYRSLIDAVGVEWILVHSRNIVGEIDSRRIDDAISRKILNIDFLTKLSDMVLSQNLKKFLTFLSEHVDR
jgi:hypothetical protein